MKLTVREGLDRFLKGTGDVKLVIGRRLPDCAGESRDRDGAECFEAWCEADEKTGE